MSCQLATCLWIGPAECCGNERSRQRAVTEARAVYEHGQEKDG
ncbi:hypothetical protein ACFY0F_26560 [Streptomyces sp. NPDC001544]